MPYEFSQYIAPAVFGLLVLCMFFICIRLGMFIGRLKTERNFRSRIISERSDAVKRSRAVLGGQFGEQLAPYMPEFPGDPTEIRFIGKPVDFICFSGSSNGEIDEIIFIEVKTGKSQLTPVEKSLREAVRDGRVSYYEYRLPQ
ncbi:hypothetical protein K7I13_04950 [Brucepastera parasyntrophica]|uniref:Holliday junction resolvase-like protein n=1 Tax=Brucepastera parasyntrophica TaxID=2880008 RepID=UPI00210B5151|nr:Holliday junction resolvase-like protein [Brucepastera parasyntrophica]ULQ60628.1 hypothetical protein K7I13_04950 [Brucepastera parasyntrophica]